MAVHYFLHLEALLTRSNRHHLCEDLGYLAL